MVDIFVPRLFVVVPFPLNRFRINTFRRLASHATLLASNFMMKRFLPALAFSFTLSLPLLAQAPAQTSSPPAAPAFPQPAHGEKLRIAGIHNAGKITDNFYRGAQPSEMGLSELKLLGISTIIDLRGEDREKISWERKRAESLGMRFVNIPVSGWAPPTDEQVIQFLSLLRSEPAQKVFVHCRFGDDRTGVFTAVYRMAIDKWPADQAMKEMYFFGFNGFWHPSMKSFVRDFPARLNSAPALAPLRTPPRQP
jgi:tyrosine-protein phosphatase SIW14